MKIFESLPIVRSSRDRWSVIPVYSLGAYTLTTHVMVEYGVSISYWRRELIMTYQQLSSSTLLSITTFKYRRVYAHPQCLCVRGRCRQGGQSTSALVQRFTLDNASTLLISMSEWIAHDMRLDVRDVLCDRGNIALLVLCVIISEPIKMIIVW